MSRVLAVAAVFFGTAVVGFSPNRWDTVILDLPRGHGIHLHDVIGMAFVTVGVGALWWSGRQPGSRRG